MSGESLRQTKDVGLYNSEICTWYTLLDHVTLTKSKLTSMMCHSIKEYLLEVKKVLHQ